MKLRLHFIIISLLLLPKVVYGDFHTQEWNYSSLSVIPENWGSLEISVNNEIKTPDGQPSLDCVPAYDSEAMKWPSHLLYPALAAIAKDAATTEVVFWIKGEAGSQISLRITNTRGVHYTDTQSYNLTGAWQKIEFKEKLNSPISGKWLSAPRLLLTNAQAGQHFFIGPVTFTAID